MEQLIRDLNSPTYQGNPQAIHQLQREIQRLQAQTSAWQTALELLDSDDQILQFYGALTLGIKVNADWDKDQISQNRAQYSSFLEHLIIRFIRLSKHDSEVVVNKLSTVLAAIFTKRDAAWAHPCRQILACILAGGYRSEAQAPSAEQSLLSVSTIDGPALRSILRLALSIQEAAASTRDGRDAHQVELMVSNNISDVWQVLLFTLEDFSLKVTRRTGQTPRLSVKATDHYMIKLIGEALQQIPMWTKSVAAQMDQNAQVTTLLSSSLTLVLELMNHPSAAELCMPCLTALQTDCSRVLKRVVPEYVQLLNSSDSVQMWIEQMLTGEYAPEAISYVEFLDAIFMHIDLTTDTWLTDTSNVQLLSTVEKLLHCEVTAMVDDEICQSILDIVTSIAEGYSDWSEPSSFDQDMQTFIKRTCLAVLSKCQFPEAELDSATSAWGEEELSIFEDFRFTAADFFQTAFGILGHSLAQGVTGTIATRGQSWSAFESALFVLTAISDSLSNDPEKCDPYLNQIFHTQSWMMVISTEVQAPTRVSRIAIKLLAETTSYLQRNSQHLISSLDFLFRCLHTRALSRESARAILNLCDSQRRFLVQGLSQFLQTISTLQDLPLNSSCKIITAVSALIQAIPSENDKIEPIRTILQLIEALEQAHSANPPPSEDDNFDPLFDRMAMLASMAKGLQSPADTPVDLDATPHPGARFWISGPGMPTQKAIINLLAEPWSQTTKAAKSALVGEICDFLKAGFKESHPVATKFSSPVSVELLQSLINLDNPNIDQTMSTISCYISATPGPQAQSTAEIDLLLDRTIAMTQESIQHLTNESDFSPPSAILDFISRSFPKWGLHYLTGRPQQDMMPTFFEFAIILLRGTNDTFPRRQAASFFTAFLDHTSPSTPFMNHYAANQIITLLMENYFPTILGVTIHLLAGECARSELESLSQLLRAFVAKQAQRTKLILMEAIKPENNVLTVKACEATTPEQRARFVAQVDALRGTRKTNDIVKEFWIACKGGQFGYIT